LVSSASAAADVGEDSLDQPSGMRAEPSWRDFATFLYCGKIYE
jgi:hypothetical protein